MGVLSTGGVKTALDSVATPTAVHTATADYATQAAHAGPTAIDFAAHAGTTATATTDFPAHVSTLAANAGLPEGIDLTHTLLVIGVMGVVTVILRIVPFIFIRSLSSSEFVGVLGRMMPIGVTVVLVVYTALSEAQGAHGWKPVLVASALTVALHLWRRTAWLSILAGTASYVVLINFV
ncbi:MAG: AzlD domain-containing protein [Bifidobacterium sp.]|nr:AzlD domain-containing protein [Bifidobacterium sp.]